jgi:hypothetical protein
VVKKHRSLILNTAPNILFFREEAERLCVEVKRVQLEVEEVRRERTSLIEMNNELSAQVRTGSFINQCESNVMTCSIVG